MIKVSETPTVGHIEYQKYVEKLFEFTIEDIEVHITDFHAEMRRGLCGYGSSLEMLPTFLDRPYGIEKGEFIALDLGGSNFRVLLVELDGENKAEMKCANKYTISRELMTGTAVELFDFIADSILQFLVDNNIDTKKNYDMAFTFSFPLNQTNIASGILLYWTKGFNIPDLVGKDVSIYLHDALLRKGLENISLAAIVNDTVGTLVNCAYSDNKCDVGVIIGTGTNACYPERVANIKKWRGVDPEKFVIINIEWANFDVLNKVTVYDKILDKHSPNSGRNKTEKMVSGMYLGEIFRLAICDLQIRDIILKDKNLTKFDLPFSVDTEILSKICLDNSSNLADVEQALSVFGIINISMSDKRYIKNLCSLIAGRSARLVAASILAVISWMDREVENKHTVAIDGSLYEKFPGYKEEMIQAFKEIYPKRYKNIKLVLSKDGSGKGAAIAAACSHYTI